MFDTEKVISHELASRRTNIFTATHPFLTMMTMAPRSRMRTTRPPAQAPRISPMSSACWDTSRARLESLQAAAQHDREVRERRRKTKTHLHLAKIATVDGYSILMAKIRCYM